MAIEPISASINRYQDMYSKITAASNGSNALAGAGSNPEKSDSAQKEKIAREVERLKQTEEKVKNHEAAHKAAGGQLAGSASYQYTTGPDGKSYIVGGEVQIDMSTGSTPQETISRMETVRSAALAPADPSSQDRAVAAEAVAIATEARQELAKQPENSGNIDKKTTSTDTKEKEPPPKITATENSKKNDTSIQNKQESRPAESSVFTNKDKIVESDIRVQSGGNQLTSTYNSSPNSNNGSFSSLFSFYG